MGKIGVPSNASTSFRRKKRRGARRALASSLASSIACVCGYFGSVYVSCVCAWESNDSHT